MKALLTLLFFLLVSVAFAQPQQGPFTVYSVGHDTVLQDLHVAIQADTTAYLYFVESIGDTAWQTQTIRVYLGSRRVSRALTYRLPTNWNQHIEDVFSDGITEPFILHTADAWTDSGHAYETLLFGPNETYPVYSGLWGINLGYGGTRFIGGKLGPRQGGGMLLCGAEEVQWGIESDVYPFVLAFPENSVSPNLDFGASPVVSTVVSPFFAVSNAPDSAILLASHSYQFDVLLFAMSADSVLPADTLRCQPMLERVGLTRGGRMLALDSQYDVDSTAVDFIDISRNGACTVTRLMSVLTLNKSQIAFREDYGFAVAELRGSDLLLARIDTNGVAVQPRGVMGSLGAIPTRPGIGLTIAAGGRVVACWTETNGSGTTELKLASVGWTTPLGANEPMKLQPSSFSLSAFPNPFNPTTTLHYEVERAGKASLTICDLMGREVASLLNGKVEAGVHDLTWDASRLSSGVYFVRLETVEGVRVRKLLLMK